MAARPRAEDVGLCPATLLTDPLAASRDEVDGILSVAAEADFSSIALWVMHGRTLGIEAARSRCAALGLSVGAVEGAFAWIEGAEAGGEEAEFAPELAAAVGAEILLAAAITPEVDPGRAAEGLAALCEAAEARGQRVAVEFIPGTALPSLAAARKLLGECGAPNVGVVIDMLHWHHQPGGPDFETLRALPAERIHYVQVCDAPSDSAPPDSEYLLYAVRSRALAGEGVVDIGALLRALDAHGASPYFAHEVFNESLAQKGPLPMARRLRSNSDSLFG